MAEIILLSGEIQSGKTSLCLDLYHRAREKGIVVGGVISPPVIEGGEKVAINVIELKTGDEKRLAELKRGQGGGLETKRWLFFSQGVEWGNQGLLNASPCQLLIVDELGPLEFQRGKGWMNGFFAVDSGAYQAAVVVIRPSLIPNAVRRWPGSRIIDIDTAAHRGLTGRELLASLHLDFR